MMGEDYCWDVTNLASLVINVKLLTWLIYLVIIPMCQPGPRGTPGRSGSNGNQGPKGDSGRSGIADVWMDTGSDHWNNSRKMELAAFCSQILLKI